MKHADLVASDFLLDRAMNELCGLIQELPYDDFKELGALKYEVNSVDFAEYGGTREDFLLTDLLIFEERLLVLELIQNKGAAKANKVDHQEKQRIFKKAYRIQELDYKYVTNGNDTLLFARKYRGEKIHQEESFVLLLSSRDLAIEIEGILQGYVKDSQQQVELIGTKHENHKYRKFRGTGNLTAITTRCGECDRMMRGLFYNGIECKTCEKIYHK